MTVYYHGKEKMKPERQTQRPYWATCQHVLTMDGKAYICGSETEKGSHACKSCKRLEAKTEGFQLRDMRLVKL